MAVEKTPPGPTGTTVVEYLYDAEGRRIKKKVGSAETYYFYGLDGRVAVEKAPPGPSGTTTVEYLYFAGRMIAQYQSGGTQFAHADHLGSTRVMTPYPYTGAVSESVDYLPFGEQISGGSTSTHKFTGHERDGETGLDYMGARYYTSLAGRFLSTDPFIVTPDRFLDPQQFNLYAYVRNNPLSYVDPEGMTLTLSGNVQRAMHEVCAIMGGDCANMSYDEKTNTITVTATEDEIKNNEGLALIRDLVQSSYKYDLFVGAGVETRAGKDKKSLHDFDVAGNLTNLEDERISKTDNMKPKAGIDAQIGFDPRDENFSLKNDKLPAPSFTSIFHELAEAYAYVDKGKTRYEAAHRDAEKREYRLREQRPHYRVHNMGSGRGQGTRQVIKQ